MLLRPEGPQEEGEGAGDPLAERLRLRLESLEPGPRPLVLAVSGGSDSAALLRLAAASPQIRRRVALVATVDHGLRPESAAEAAQVALWAAGLDLPHETLIWTGDKPRGDLSARARAARHDLLRAAAGARGAALVLAHTAEDQAETFLMNLARGSGVQGLAAMRPRSLREGVPLLRPLLEVGREELRAWLRARGAPWIDDPSNSDLRRLRPRLRQAAALLEGFGLSRARLLETVAHLARAREALEAAEAALSAEALTEGPLGELRLSRAALAGAPREVALRFFAESLRRAGGAEHPPRFASLERAFDLWLSGGLGGGISLGGALLRPLPEGGLRLLPEPAGTPPPALLAPGESRLWAGRWRVDLAPEAPQGLELAALGAQGEASLKAAARKGWSPPELWRLARPEARRASPALRLEGALWAVPAAGWGTHEARARLRGRRDAGR
ncbi:tRNA lysidine(34) synthetase TilS [Neomegalonema sp.]|uniref:tRNA lysidine(34) synthetase TilS n=1 Tax=Neomegalonema sp. TaxID=2039713 RepID=UPI0026104B48|nr:tRNA lysidine(34) synthetase TilS [Neomegalonema sp.]MDD2869378.1 tRNA lysidine(34) synthetase TilS [Neomegalonema sp.]